MIEFKKYSIEQSRIQKLEKDDDIIVEVTSTAICGSDLHLVHGLVIRKTGTVALVGVYGNKYNNFSLGNFFSKNINLAMGQCLATKYVDIILTKIQKGKFDATDIITHMLPLSEGSHAYSIFDAKEDGCIKVIFKP